MAFLFTKVMRYGIIGGGNMGKALATGLIDRGYAQAKDFTISRRRLEKLEDLKALGCQVQQDNPSLVEQSDIIFLAILPQKLDDILSEIKDSIGPEHIIISLVTAVPIQTIQDKLSSRRVVRAMPNTAISIGESMTCITGLDLQSEDVRLTQNIFNELGETLIINEEKMTSATALCACGIAFFLRAIRAASQGGTEIDFHAKEALKMAAQTAKGAASLLLTNASHPEDEIDKVTSPKGCTISGLNQMEHNGFSSAFIKGITTSAEKAGNLYSD